MHIKTFVGVYPNLTRIRASVGSFFNRVKEFYPAQRASGMFLPIPEASCFLYRIEATDRSYTGVIACLDVLDFIEGRILQHERTLPAEEEKQMRLLVERRAAVKPVLMAYPNAAPLDRWIADYISANPVFLEIVLAKEHHLHRLWKVSDPAEIEALTTLFDQHVPKVYIADGHHRSACSALLYRRVQEKNETGITCDRFLCGLFPESELEILAFNRLVQLPDGLDEETLLKRLADVCTIKLLKRKRQPSSKHEMTMIVGDRGYSLRWKPEFLDPQASLSEMLDTALLNKYILKNILGITDIRTDRRVSYTEGPKGLRAITRRIHEDPRCIAFCLYPISAEEFFAVADAGEVLPPKSTWFEPRMKNGLLVQEL